MQEQLWIYKAEKRPSVQALKYILDVITAITMGIRVFWGMTMNSCTALERP
jgi:hypothetical protein